jgi:DNA-binding SARP family transcriptional activator
VVENGTTVRVRLFGRTEVQAAHGRLTGSAFGGVKPKQILQLLVLRGALHKTELAELLWQGHPPADHVATLESYVSVLRRRIDPGVPARASVILTRDGGYAIDEERLDSDVARFDSLIALGRVANGAPAGPHRLQMAGRDPFAEAVHLAAEPLLADQPHATWAVDARERYRSLFIDAATEAARHALEAGDPRRALEFASRATELDSLAERAWQVLIAAHHAVNDRPAGLRAYDQCRRILARELGVAPAAATTAAFVRLLREEPAAVRATDLAGVVAAVLSAAKEMAEAGEPAAMLLHHAEALASRMVAAGRPLPAREYATAA